MWASLKPISPYIFARLGLLGFQVEKLTIIFVEFLVGIFPSQMYYYWPLGWKLMQVRLSIVTAIKPDLAHEPE